MIKKGIVAVVIITMLLQIGLVFANETYYVQLGAFEVLKNAERYSDYIHSLGYDCVVKEVYGWHKVFAGPYDTMSQAVSARDALLKSGEKGFVVSEGSIYQNTTPLKEKDASSNDQTDETTVDENKSDSDEEGADPTNEEGSKEEASSSEENTVDETSEPVTTEPSSTEPEKIDDVASLDEIDTSLDMDSLQSDSERDENEKYKEFTIILIMVLWLIFILVVLAYRLNQNREKMK